MNIQETIEATKKWKRGETREDGKIFWQYRRRGSEMVWMTKEKFQENCIYTAKRMKRYVDENSEAMKIKRKQAYAANKESVLEYMRNRYKLVKHKKKAYDHTKKPIRNAQLREKYASDPIENLTVRIRARIREAFRACGFKKGSKTAEVLGCSWLEFHAHIESQFYGGMSWQNRHLWHIDHIIPVSIAKTVDEVKKLNHYSNLRPLWASENLKKSNKYENKH